MNQPAEILYIHQDGLVTGSAISLRNLIFGLDRNRFRPLVLLAQEGPARGLYEALDIPVSVLPIRGMWTAPGPRFPKPDYFRNWLALLPNPRLEQYLKTSAPSLVHVNDKTMLPAGLTARRLGLPVVWQLRSTYAVSHSRLQAAVSRAIIRHTADHLIAISEDEADGFDDLPTLSIIHNSVDFDRVELALRESEHLRAELGISRDEVLVGTVTTTINERRGSWDFIETAGLLKALLPEVQLRFLIVGRIPNAETEAEAWQRAETSGVRQQLTLTGFRSDALELMASFDIMVVCNRLGVLGRMPFEAMALGRPLVVTAGHSGRSSVVIDNQTALVVPPAEPEAIAQVIIRLLQSPPLREQLAQQGQIYARQHFDPIKNAQAVMNIYEDLLVPK